MKSVKTTVELTEGMREDIQSARHILSERMGMKLSQSQVITYFVKQGLRSLAKLKREENEECQVK